MQRRQFRKTEKNALLNANYSLKFRFKLLSPVMNSCTRFGLYQMAHSHIYIPCRGMNKTKDRIVMDLNPQEGSGIKTRIRALSEDN